MLYTLAHAATCHEPACQVFSMLLSNKHAKLKDYKLA